MSPAPHLDRVVGIPSVAFTAFNCIVDRLFPISRHAVSQRSSRMFLLPGDRRQLVQASHEVGQ
ncbi:hypothetical protein BH11PSE5_BH11PSE5_26600 [soil metagenome]